MELNWLGMWYRRRNARWRNQQCSLVEHRKNKLVKLCKCAHWSDDLSLTLPLHSIPSSSRKDKQASSSIARNIRLLSLISLKNTCDLFDGSRVWTDRKKEERWAADCFISLALSLYRHVSTLSFRLSRATLSPPEKQGHVRSLFTQAQMVHRAYRPLFSPRHAYGRMIQLNIPFDTSRFRWISGWTRFSHTHHLNTFYSSIQGKSMCARCFSWALHLE